MPGVCSLTRVFIWEGITHTHTHTHMCTCVHIAASYPWRKALQALFPCSVTHRNYTANQTLLIFTLVSTERLQQPAPSTHPALGEVNPTALSGGVHASGRSQRRAACTGAGLGCGTRTGPSLSPMFPSLSHHCPLMPPGAGPAGSRTPGRGPGLCPSLPPPTEPQTTGGAQPLTRALSEGAVSRL